jgi:FMN phosphatase YigB (HAD superfamily)
MTKAVLFDLDDTLLINDSRAFMNRYFTLLSEFAEPVMEPKAFLEDVARATRTTILNTDPELTNADVFWAEFEALSDQRRADLEPFFADFYTNQFARLRSVTSPEPRAADLVESALADGRKVVIATNPLFPRPAIEQRLAWAGIPVENHAFALVTAYENMHAAKPHAAYYREILDLIAVAPNHSIMVGNDWENDIMPAAAVGLHTYWVNRDGSPPPDSSLVDAYGTMDELYERVVAGWLDDLAPGR